MGVAGAMGVVACGNGVVTKGGGTVMLLLKPGFGQRSKLAVSVKYTVLARTTPVCRRSGAERAACELLSVHR